MSPHQRLSWTLGLSLIIWSPIALAVIGGQVDATKGCLIYLASLGFSWVGTGVIQRIAENYRETQNSLYRAKQEIERIERRATQLAEAEEEERRARRASDAE